MASTPPVTVCGSLSLHPVSLGASMHRAGYAALDLPFMYAPFKVSSEGLSAALGGMRALGIRGFGVSMPFKIEVIPLLDALDPVAKRIGAVNTIVNDAGTLTGFNTDAIGAARALQERRSIEGARILVLGAGGAARAVAHAMIEHGAAVTIANRDHEKALNLASAVGGEAIDWADTRRSLDRWNVIVNATSLGMDVDGPSASPLVESQLSPSQVIMDIVYKPLDTALLEAARRRGCSVVHGGRMLLHQAAAQFELYTQKNAPLAVMDAALRATIG